MQLRLSLFALAIGVFFACSGKETVTGVVPGGPTEAWFVESSPEEVGWSIEALAEARRFYDDLDSVALMVIENGRIVVSWGAIDTKFFCASIRKSYLSALYGIHATTGAIDLDKTLEQLGIDDNNGGLTAAEKQARVSDIIKSRSGVYHTSAAQSPSARAGLPERGSHAPGTHWHYNNWDFNAAGTIFEQETGLGIFEEFQRQIAIPTGMRDFVLEEDTLYDFEPQYSIHPAYHFQMTARDMARFGLMMQRGGRWMDRQLIPESWVEESTRSHSFVDDGLGYGCMWWIIEGVGFMALGLGGQIIEVRPAENLTIVHLVNTDIGDTVSVPDYLELIELVLAARN